MSFDNNIPIYLQLVERIKAQIISGALSPGERVLSVREWALQEKVNPNTMQRALSELEEMGLILTERTNGKFVTSDLHLICHYKDEEAKRLADEFYKNMKNIGYDATTALQYLEDLKGENS